MGEPRLGDEVDDHCTKCKRITNHSIVSLLNGEPAKVRCRTCYNDHDFRRGEAPPSKKDLKKAQLFQEVLSGVNSSADAAAVADPAPPDAAAGEAPEPAPAEGEGEAETVVKPAGRKTRGRK